MNILSCENSSGRLSSEEIESLVDKTIDQFSNIKKALLIHPDYSRHDFTEVIAPCLYRALERKGLQRLDTLNASGTHRLMTEEELCSKLNMSKERFPLLGKMFNHEFDNAQQLTPVGEIEADVVKEKTVGHLDSPLEVTVNKLLFDGYDLVLTVSGTVPHEATGFSGGTKILFPGVAGPEVIGLFHWAAVLIGIPTIIGQLDNAARDVVNIGAGLIFDKLGSIPAVSLNMVYSEDENHNVVPKGLYSGVGLEGYSGALKAAANLSAKTHIRYLAEAKHVVVQQLPKMYDEVWTAGKGSYKLQRAGVLEEGGEIILYAPHIDCFHSNKRMDDCIRAVGYHGRDYVVDYCHKNPQFDKNAASHVINVRGLGQMVNGKEEFPFTVTLATSIPKEECEAVGLSYRDPKTLHEEDFQDPGQLWIPDGGQWLYARH